jgi:hypothetical protein
VGITDGRLSTGGTVQGAGEGDPVSSDDTRADLTNVRVERKLGAAKDVMGECDLTTLGGLAALFFSRRNYDVQSMTNGQLATVASYGCATTTAGLCSAVFLLAKQKKRRPFRGLLLSG